MRSAPRILLKIQPPVPPEATRKCSGETRSGNMPLPLAIPLSSSCECRQPAPHTLRRGRNSIRSGAAFAVISCAGKFASRSYWWSFGMVHLERRAFAQSDHPLPSFRPTQRGVAWRHSSTFGAHDLSRSSSMLSRALKGWWQRDSKHKCSHAKRNYIGVGLHHVQTKRWCICVEETACTVQ